jgi:hypothetical protein
MCFPASSLACIFGSIHRRISVVGVKGSCEDCPLWAPARLHAALVGAYTPMLATLVSGKLRRFSQLMEETEHFCGCGQEKVAKIVQCGEHYILSKIVSEATCEGGL